MLKFDPETFGQLNADTYDDWQDPGTTMQSVALIHELAAGGRILELAIGTGRMAVPLAGLGNDICGIDASAEMIAKMREKPGGADIRAKLGDFADVEIEGTFDHIFLVFNTLFNLTDQDAQLRCFQNVARKLNRGGTFLIDAFVPDFSTYVDGQRTRTRGLGMDSAFIEASLHDSARQVIEFQRIRVNPGGMSLVPLVMRYAYPAEIDLMARVAGLEKLARWGDWTKGSFDEHSKMHVSVYRKPV